MRLDRILFASWATIALASGSGVGNGDYIQRRQDGSASGFPTLGSGNSPSASTSSAPSPSGSNTQSSAPASNNAAPSPSVSGSGTGKVESVQGASITSNISPTSSLIVTSSTSIPTTSANGTTTATLTDDTALPLEPQITPAFAIGGVILILTGLVYTLIGVKNKWVHTFLSTAYLTSLSITVLIVYVLNPPISNAIQGAYFVGIFMTGVIFGAGALVFKEVTEGLGCLLGGFCLGMWFLTLKEGGLVTNTGGKAIFISVFCVVVWSLSFSHYTRAYGLIFSIAFSGATAFVLGIDCFSRGGLKEFWVYIWDLNSNIFPLNTNSYPISRGTRVETIVIVLASIIGIISQMKLWKIVKDRQKQRDEMQTEETRRREAVEAALGRHLERQNDRDRSQWEKQYGDRLNAKRETMLWTDAHGEKGYSKMKETELNDSQKSSSTESLEMANMSRRSRSMYVTRIKRNSTAVTAIPEGEESDAANDKAQVRQRVLDQLEGNSSSPNSPPLSSTGNSHEASPNVDNQRDDKRHSTQALSVSDLIIDHASDRNSSTSKRKSAAIAPEVKGREKRNSDYQQYLTAPETEHKKKRRSFTSLLSRTKEDDTVLSTSPSQEALVIPATTTVHSRGSSLAATLDFENEVLDLPNTDLDLADPYTTPEIVVSPAGFTQSNVIRAHSATRGQIHEPELEEENFDIDPEEFVRPTTKKSERETGLGISSEDGPTSTIAHSELSSNEVLTTDALKLMPSQLSHVVMSYRTNEWAKHISTADAPLIEESEQIQDHEAEVPTHLADPQSVPESKRSSLGQSIPSPPEVPAPVPSTLPSTKEGIRINPVLQQDQVPISAVVQPPQLVQPAQARLSDAKSIPRGLRSTSTPTLVQQALQSTPIVEKVPTNFAPSPHVVVRSSSSRSLSGYDMSNPQLPARPATASAHQPNLHHSASRLSMVSENGMAPNRSNSFMSNYARNQIYSPSYRLGQGQGQVPYSNASNNPYYQQATSHPIPSRSDTRLPSYDSHQPLRRNESLESHRREAMFADWRGSNAQRAPVVEQNDATEYHRRQMLVERHQVKMQEEQEKNFKWQQEMVVDARMRSKDMQELHREAMRRMQAGANKKI